MKKIIIDSKIAVNGKKSIISMDKPIELYTKAAIDEMLAGLAGSGPIFPPTSVVITDITGNNITVDIVSTYDLTNRIGLQFTNITTTATMNVVLPSFPYANAALVINASGLGVNLGDVITATAYDSELSTVVSAPVTVV